MALTQNIFHDLEVLGRSGREYVPESLLDEEVAWRFLVGGCHWSRAADERSVEQIADLIRGLVLYCRASRRQIGGSVSPVIALYRALVRRTPVWEPEFTSWIVDHTTNQHEPFGTSVVSGRSYAEYRQNSHIRETQRVEAEAERLKSERAGRREREGKLATERLANAVRRGDLLAVQAMMSKGADVTAALPDRGSLVAHATAHGRTAMAEFLGSIGVA